MKTLLSTLTIGIITSISLSASAQIVNVPGTSDPWLAGQPAGATASFGDVAPQDSPVLAGAVSPGSTLNWSAWGLEANGPSYTEVGPNGDTADLSGFGLIDHTTGNENGISDILNVPIDSLIGVFLGAGVPSGPGPSPLDFSSIGLSYGSLTPGLDQPFYMGDGSAQSLVVPTGATRLYLGTMDGFGWDNNPGDFHVQFTSENVSPLPDSASTLAMLSAAFAGVSLIRRKIS
jgi:hypothetical protein